MEEDLIHVVFAADANYAMPLTVAMCSTARNCHTQRRLLFHVIQSGIGPELREKVELSLVQANFPYARISWLDAPVDSMKNLKVSHPHTTSLTFARLFIPELLPVEVERAIYLDCDIVVIANIAELWDVDLGYNSLMAVRDYSTTSVSNPAGITNFRELGIPAEAGYFNAGVLVININKWRQRGTTAVLLEYLEKHFSIIQMADQEALNAVLFDDWSELDYRWNWQIPWRKYRDGSVPMPWDPSKENRSIIHFTTAEKPWYSGCDYKEREYFIEYLDLTEWKGWRVPLIEELSGRFKRKVDDARDVLGMKRRRITDWIHSISRSSNIHRKDR